MNGSARVTRIDVLRELRAAWIKFSEDAEAALCGVDMDARRLIDWLEHEQADHWRRAIRQRQEEYALTKSDLARRRIAAINDRHPDLTEQKRLLRRAELRLEEAQTKLENCRVWARRVQEATLRYTGLSQQLREHLEGETPKGAALIGRLIDAIDAYLNVAPPTSEPIPGPADMSPADAFDLTDDETVAGTADIQPAATEENESAALESESKP